MAVLVALALILMAVQLVRPVPAVRLRVRLPAVLTVPGPAGDIPWPSGGQSALAVAGVGMVGTSGARAPQPIASLAKMMVAYLILHDHPLAVGQGGPKLTLTPADVQLYLHDKAGGQSVLPVASGEVLDERQLLQGLLLPSGNNVATMLARWDAGSLTAFVAKMNATAKALGMTQTHYVDASGVHPATVSTAVDQIKLAEADMRMPAFAAIVRLPQATLPVAGVVYNVNADLGRAGIIGIKTGSTTEAGGCLVAAREVTVAGKPQLVIAAVLGQGGLRPLPDALAAGERLMQAVPALLRSVKPIRAGTVAATLVAPWAKPVPVPVPAAVPTFVGWGGLRGSAHVTPLVSPKPGQTVAAGARVATLTVAVGDQKAVLSLKAAAAIARPPLRWRLTRP